MEYISSRCPDNDIDEVSSVDSQETLRVWPLLIALPVL